MSNDLNIAWELADASGLDVLLTRGLLRKQSLSLEGGQAEASFTAYSFDGHDRRRPLQTRHRRGCPRPRRIRRLIPDLQHVLVEVGLDLTDTAHRVSTFPADYSGLNDRGRLEPDACADLVVLDSQLRVVRMAVAERSVGLA